MGYNKLLCDIITVRHKVRLVPWGVKVFRKNSDIIEDIFCYGGFYEVCFDLATNEKLECI